MPTMIDEPSPQRRHSVAENADTLRRPEERARREAENGLRQFDLGMRIVEDAIARPEPFRLRPSHVQALHREALAGLSEWAGNWRPAGIAIEGSRHAPAGAHLVPELVEDMCDYVNARWDRPAVHLAAYVMWRLNWIHPFTDGNGRTSRIVSYVVLCITLRSVLRGRNTIPDQIVDNRRPYFDALEAADLDPTQPDLHPMEALIEGMLATQLLSMIETATDKNYGPEPS